MDESEAIENMFREIRHYNGDFGDPIVDLITFSSLEVLRAGEQRHTIGAGVALLVEFQNHIDNATYEGALTGTAAANIRSAIAESLCQNYPLLQLALEAALQSQLALESALKQVYVEHIENA